MKKDNKYFVLVDNEILIYDTENENEFSITLDELDAIVKMVESSKTFKMMGIDVG